ncbi:hypothetical protein [Streptomyces sp. NPDC086519]
METLLQDHERVGSPPAALGEVPPRALLVPAGDLDEDESESHICRGVD